MSGIPLTQGVYHSEQHSTHLARGFSVRPGNRKKRFRRMTRTSADKPQLRCAFFSHRFKGYERSHRGCLVRRKIRRMPVLIEPSPAPAKQGSASIFTREARMPSFSARMLVSYKLQERLLKDHLLEPDCLFIPFPRRSSSM